MDQSNLAVIVDKLRIAYGYYFQKLDDVSFAETITLYTEILQNYNFETCNRAITEIIKKNKFMPTVAEIIEKCEKEKINQRFLVLEEMVKDDYFKDVSEYDKAIKWLETEKVPHWFKNDMKKYEDLRQLNFENNLKLKGENL